MVARALISRGIVARVLRGLFNEIECNFSLIVECKIMGYARGLFWVGVSNFV